MRIYAIDPGTRESAIVVMGFDGKIESAAKHPNERIAVSFVQHCHSLGSFLVVEKIESYGMPVGVEVFDTVFWAGRFVEAWCGIRPTMQSAWTLLPRRAVKLALCGSMKATDATIRQALIDRYGPGKEKAIGRKAAPGPLYGIKSDLWSALALGVTYLEQRKEAA